MRECGNAKTQANRAERQGKRMMNRAMENMPMIAKGPDKAIARGPRGNTIVAKGVNP